MQLSLPEELRQRLPDVADGDQMVILLGPIHPLRSQHADRDLLPQEVIDQRPGYPIVKELLLEGVQPLLFRVGLDQLPQGLSIDVVVHLAADHRLVEIESTGTPPRPNATSIDDAIDNPTRLPLLLDEGKDESDDVRHHVAVLELLRFLPLLCDVGLGTVILVPGGGTLLEGKFRLPRGGFHEAGLPQVLAALLDQDGLAEGLFTEIRVLFLLHGGKGMEGFSDRQEPVGAIGEEVGRVGEVELHRRSRTIGGRGEEVTKYYISNQSIEHQSRAVGDQLARGASLPHALPPPAHHCPPLLLQTRFFRFLAKGPPL